ncbi:MAG TPA: alpha/beta fold hydrolase [Gemmatimonadaceae bacterium]|jgi:pimeloyl-ACP methyl ester carboxylesterase|nr:alpha/beta fold hydrolase [Gemmatimonadaceae bacterium]
MYDVRSWIGAALLVAAPSLGVAQDKYFDADGVRIHYVEQGKGEPVVLLHGLGGSVGTWTSTGILQALAQDHRVIAFDMRGHGKSDKPHDPKKYGREMVLDVVRLLDHLSIQRAHVAGYSLGGMLISQLLTLYPDRILSATLIAAGGRFGVSPDAERELEAQAREVEAECVSRSLIIALAPTDAPKPSDERIAQLSKDCFADSTRDRFATAAFMRSRSEQVVDPAAAARVTVPTLGIVGSADVMKRSLDSLAAMRADVRVIVLDGATHAGERGILNRPELKTALREFLASHRVR